MPGREPVQDERRDEVLVERIRQGDDAALTTLYRRHVEAIYRFVLAQVRDPSDAEDLTQQTFLVAQRTLSQLRDVRSARNWLFAIARNCFLKDRQRRRPVPAARLRLDLDTVPAEIPDVEDIDAERLQGALCELPELFRIVLVMFYYEGRSYREIAEDLDLPMGTVMSRLARAKAHLRSRLVPERAAAEN